MTDHLSPTSLNSIVDGELSAERLAIVTTHLAGCPSCSAALLLVSAAILVTQRNVQRMASVPAESGRVVTEACNQAGLDGSFVADSEFAERLCLSIQLARWGLLSPASEVKA